MQDTKIRYLYEFTGCMGSTLYAALREKDFNRVIEQETRYSIEQSITGGDFRDAFVAWLEGHLSAREWREMKEKAGCHDLKTWLLTHPVPDREESLRGRFTEEEIRFLTDTWTKTPTGDHIPLLWDHIDPRDDAAVALAFGLVRDPKTEIRVMGFYCEIHGNLVKYEEPVVHAEVPICPSCEHPICPLCANTYEKDPATIEEARAYLSSCDDPAGMAYCGQCGDWSVEWMLRFLQLKKCPIPSEYLNPAPPPRPAQFVATCTVAALPDLSRIMAGVKEKFDKGRSGIIHCPHPGGEVWGIPERHPEGWIVTLCYPHER
jgi:hypothetical protein